jgi:hypothetical protein
MALLLSGGSSDACLMTARIWSAFPKPQYLPAVDEDYRSCPNIMLQDFTLQNFEGAMKGRPRNSIIG